MQLFELHRMQNATPFVRLCVVSPVTVQMFNKTVRQQEIFPDQPPLCSRLQSMLVPQSLFETRSF